MLRPAPDSIRTFARPMPPRLVVNGRKVRQLRSKAKLTQQVAAVQVSMSLSNFRRIEAGSASVQLTTLGKLAQLYDVEPEALLQWRR